MWCPDLPGHTAGSQEAQLTGPVQLGAQGQAGMDWPTEAITAAVAPWLPGFSVQVLPEIDSTNSELMRRLRHGPMAPTLLVAERQLAGRGRQGRAWHSGSGALTFSLGLGLAPVDWSGLSLVAGLSIAQSLHPALRLKWPNDIWFQDRKLAGILVETASFGELRHAVIGVGINLQPVEAGNLATAPAWLGELWPSIGAPAVLERVVPPLVAAIQQFQQQGFGPWQAGFLALDALAGRTVWLSDGTHGRAGGVDRSGALLVHTAAGSRRVTSSEVSVRPAQ